MVNNPKGTFFLSFVYASNISKTADKVFEMLDAIVDMIGEENIVLVIIDNATNYKVGAIIDGKKKKIVFGHHALLNVLI